MFDDKQNDNSLSRGNTQSPQAAGDFSLTPTSPANLEDQADTQTQGQEIPTTGSSEEQTSFENPEEVVTAPHAPKKYGGKKIIATIFGIILLLGAVATGAYLVRTQQLRIGQAWDCRLYAFNVSREGSVTVRNGSSRSEPTQQARVFINGTLVATLDVPALSPGNAATLGTVEVPQAGFTWRVDGTRDCEDEGRYEAPPKIACHGHGCTTNGDCEEGFVCVNNPNYTAGAVNICSKPQNISVCGTSENPSFNDCCGDIPTHTPTPTTTHVTAACQNVRAYDNDWNQLSLAQLESLSAGDIIRFTIVGTTSSGTFDRARFTVNGTSLGETTNLKPGGNEFYVEYTIPDGVFNFNVDAQIHHSVLDWF